MHIIYVVIKRRKVNIMYLSKYIISHYYENSQAVWLFKKEYDRNDIVDSSKRGIRIQLKEMICYIAELYEVDRKLIKHLYTSFSPIFHTGSFYFTVDNKKLIRISDHWSFSDSLNVNNVNSIHTCNWYLQVHKEDIDSIIGCVKGGKFYNYQLAELKSIEFIK